MGEQEIYDRLTEIFQDVFDDDGIELTAETSADDIDEWDSLANINIIVSVEDAFGFKLDMDEITGIRNVGEMVTVIKERTA